MLKTVYEVCEVPLRQEQSVKYTPLYYVAIPSPTRYPSQHKSLLKRLSMHRYDVSESGIICKGNEKIDYSYLFHGLFLAVRIKN